MFNSLSTVLSFGRTLFLKLFSSVLSSTWLRKASSGDLISEVAIDTSSVPSSLLTSSLSLDASDSSEDESAKIALNKSISGRFGTEFSPFCSSSALTFDSLGLTMSELAKAVTEAGTTAVFEGKPELTEFVSEGFD